ncbi:MAG: PQQ-binding-like beta-propeller repeat protein [Candidatus Nealsonbacteria bacterium]|nr:PQQ-binding-like beta-propeller repeat protein [Candidatus Nealsonbacteria bacterium]
MNKPILITVAVSLTTVVAVALIALLGSSPQAAADTTSPGDWPQWRYDAGRGGVAPKPLPGDLHLQWTRQLAPPRPAWPESQPSLRFDVSYSPVAAGKLLFVPSMVTDSVTAYDTESGKEAWRFTTDGPVRFAPIVHADRVYFGSDDGHLYCVDAVNGNLRGKVRGGPTQRNVLGNERVISTWPVRGGPVQFDGKVYFTAGIWSFMGVFVRAIDAKTGRTVWTNSREGATYQMHPHDSEAFGGLVPRGHLAATEHGVVVPGGRTPPGCFDPATGKLVSFQYIKKGGRGWEITARDRWYFTNGVMVSMADARQVAASPAVLHDAESIYGMDARGIFARPLQPGKQPGEEHLWKLSGTDRPQRLFLKAGSQFVVGGPGNVALIEAEPGGGKGDVVWKGSFDGTPWNVLAADGKLFVVTVEGCIYCFGANSATPKTYAAPVGKTQAGPATATARKILDAAKVSGGYGVIYGVGNGELADALLHASTLRLIVVDPDAKKIEAFRRRMQDAGLYGTRISAHVGTPATYRLPPYMASLVVADELDSSGIKAAFNVLRPYGGTAWIKSDAKQLAAAVEKNGLVGAKVSSAGDGLTLLIREGALPGAADWTHQYADAANTVVSRDRRAKAPLGVLWFGNGPANDDVLPRHGHGPSPQVAAGRLVIEGADMLRARDIYTGRLLWQNNLPGLGTFYDNTSHQPGAGEIGSNYVTTADTVYVVYGDAILALDAATGKQLDRFMLEPTAENPKPNWGYVAAYDDLLIATSTPVVLVGGKGKDNGKSKTTDKLVGYDPLIRRNADWKYVAGTDPKDEWIAVDFDDKSWKTAPAGFGYGDDDDKTTLDMRNKFTRVYIRKQFDGKAAMNSSEMALSINYDDAFIAYLNGKEVLRVGVGGRGKTASKIVSHEADGHEMFPIDGFRKLLQPGKNVLALEGHNIDLDSSDFSLDPYLVIKQTGGENGQPPKPGPAAKPFGRFFTPTKYSSASRRLVVMDRTSGEVRWQRDAKYGWRHNNIAVAGGKLFCIDGLSKAKQNSLNRRGQLGAGYAPKLLALDLQTGDEIWSTEEDVFGTFLSYSQEHDVLLQAGSAARDRATDESATGAIAYRGADGDVLWKDLQRTIVGPCLLHGDTIITQGPAFELMTGKPKTRRHPLTGRPLPWNFARNYGCNTIIGSEHLLTFRSAAAGYFDLERDGGTGNFGGFKSSCTSNLIVAGGLLNAPEYTRTCTCNYQNQTSLALIHDPNVETWTFNAMEWDGHPVRRVGINFGAPGDRRTDDGTLWLDYPSRGGTSPDLPLEIKAERARYVLHHSSLIRADSADGELAWVAASAVEDLRSLTLTLADDEKPRKYTVRLHFAELAGAASGDRVFAVAVQGHQVEKALDVAKQAGGRNQALVVEVPGVEVSGKLKLSLQPAAGTNLPPVLCGVEAVAEGW